MAAGRITLTVRVEPWVPVYVTLLARLGCGKLCEAAAREFIIKHGLRVAKP